MKVKVVEFEYSSGNCPVPKVLVLNETENTIEGVNLFYSSSDDEEKSLIECVLNSNSETVWDNLTNEYPFVKGYYRRYTRDNINKESLKEVEL